MDPGIPVNGARLGHDLSIGATVTYRCEPGYRLSHEEALACERNHFWSNPLPTCDGTLGTRTNNVLSFHAEPRAFLKLYFPPYCTWYARG